MQKKSGCLSGNQNILAFCPSLIPYYYCFHVCILYFFPSSSSFLKLKRAPEILFSCEIYPLPPFSSSLESKCIESRNIYISDPQPALRIGSDYAWLGRASTAPPKVPPPRPALPIAPPPSPALSQSKRGRKKSQAKLKSETKAAKHHSERYRASLG